LAAHAIVTKHEAFEMSFDVKLLGAVFTVIFVAELPDKTALATLVLATRYAPLPVFLGAALALTVQSLVAIAAGGLVSLLPARPVHIGAGLLFIVSAIVMWRRKEEGGDEETARASKSEPTFLRALSSTFGVVFIAEWGDLTQLATAGLAARYENLVTVFFGATLALWTVTGIAVLIGNRAGALMNPELTKKVAAAIFVVLGVALVAGVV
jgi:putative Ca2+/H+ antiporter (TMEM165/GDT1 family)